MDFAGKHIVVTGGSTGIGRATAELIAARGGKVALIARGPDKLADALAAIGPLAATFAADVADKAQLIAALDGAIAHHGAIDGLPPTARGPMHDQLPIVGEGGFFITANGGLGYGLPAAIGVARAQPLRKVIALLGDGSAMYTIQGL